MVMHDMMLKDLVDRLDGPSKPRYQPTYLPSSRKRLPVTGRHTPRERTITADHFRYIVTSPPKKVAMRYEHVPKTVPQNDQSWQHLCAFVVAGNAHYVVYYYHDTGCC